MKSMTKLLRIYLYILPIYSLIGIILSTFRTAYQDSYNQYFILIGAIFDLIIIVTSWKKIINHKILIIFIFLIISLIVGLLNNELSRRFLTDFSNPFFFFSKIYIFSSYWSRISFEKYMSKYYIKVSFYGSIILLPLVYFMFNLVGATRLAIFPPMEMPYAYYMTSGNILLLFISLIIVILYGKRAQLFSVIVTFFLYILLYKKKQILKYTLISFISIFSLIFVFNQYSDNLAIRRISSSVEALSQENNDSESLNKISAGRGDEIDTLLNEMVFFDFIFGKGLGFKFDLYTDDGIKTVGNIHFSPLSLMAKYGLFFTIFIYGYLIYILTRIKNYTKGGKYILSAWATCLIIFLESFFSYAIFVIPIFPVVISYLLKTKNSEKI